MKEKDNRGIFEHVYVLAGLNFFAINSVVRKIYFLQDMKNPENR